MEEGEEVLGNRNARAYINDHLLITQTHDTHAHDRDHVLVELCENTILSNSLIVRNIKSKKKKKK